MRLIFFGPPGAGKGTQAGFIAGRFNIPHISTGDIFRDNITRHTPLGIEAKRYSDSGNLVPDSVTNAMVKGRLEQGDCTTGFLLDGFPRTIAQADELDAMLVSMKTPLDAVINLLVPDQEILGRLSQRGRADDSVETIQHRLHVYHENTEPLVHYYRQRSLIRDVVGVGPIDDITKRILAALNHHTA